jgi:hypothetical protein
MELLEIAKANAAKALGTTNFDLPASLRTVPVAKETSQGTTAPSSGAKFKVSHRGYLNKFFRKIGFALVLPFLGSLVNLICQKTKMADLQYYTVTPMKLGGDELLHLTLY